VAVLADTADIIRLSLHVTAAAVWVGGQATLAGLVPALRREAPGAVVPAGRQFARLAWPAYALLVITGIWNVTAVHPSRQGSAWRTVLAIKIIVVLTSGVTAWLHQRTTTTRGRALWGALTSLSALSALVLGVALAG
jgi:putative copper export protein